MNKITKPSLRTKINSDRLFHNSSQPEPTVHLGKYKHFLYVFWEHIFLINGPITWIKRLQYSFISHLRSGTTWIKWQQSKGNNSFFLQIAIQFQYVKNRPFLLVPDIVKLVNHNKRSKAVKLINKKTSVRHRFSESPAYN